TGHAVLVAKDKINTPFLIINGDDFYGRNSFEVSSEFLRNRCSEKEYCLPGYKLENVLSDGGTVKRGVCKVANGFLSHIKETFEISMKENGVISGLDGERKAVELNTSDPISMNMFGVHPSIFNHFERKFEEFLREDRDPFMGELLLSNVFGELIQEGLINMKVLENNSEWFGVTYKEDGPVVREKLSELVKNGVYPSPLI
ncbi:MAG: nucleotidyltransferase, partial [bacterium]